MSLIPGMNVEQVGVRRAGAADTHLDSVNTRSIATVLAPEFMRDRYAFEDTVKTALGVSSIEVTIPTGAQGNWGVSFMPQIPLAGTPGKIYNNEFNLATGLQATDTTLTFAGSFNGVPAATFDSYRVTAVSVQVIPSTSITSNGAYTMAYFPKSKASATISPIGAKGPGIPLSGLKNAPYTTTANARTPVRMVAVFSDASASELMDPATSGLGGGYFLIYGSGWSVSTDAVRLTITTVMEFIPAAASLPICPMDNPIPAAMTEQFESVIFAKFPVLQSLDPQDVKPLIDVLCVKTLRGFEEALDIIATAVSSIKPRAYSDHFLPSIGGYGLQSINDFKDGSQSESQDEVEVVENEPENTGFQYPSWLPPDRAAAFMNFISKQHAEGRLKNVKIVTTPEGVEFVDLNHN